MTDGRYLSRNRNRRSPIRNRSFTHRLLSITRMSRREYLGVLITSRRVVTGQSKLLPSERTTRRYSTFSGRSDREGASTAAARNTRCQFRGRRCCALGLVFVGPIGRHRRQNRSSERIYNVHAAAVAWTDNDIRCP